MTELYQDFTLLVDGKEAFPVILNAIDAATVSVRINMFIWRDDEIGNRLGEAVLRAADRGVKVHISVDRYGVVLEKTEECRRSFFHKKQTLAERIKIAILRGMYALNNTPKAQKDEETPLYRELLAHENVTVEKDVFKADHSKYYIIDGKTLILGGINVEDKENGVDMQGRAYQDYMVKIEGAEYVQAFLAKLDEGKDAAETYFFGLNRKLTKRFEMERLYLDMIEGAKERLLITMAYFSPLKKFEKAIIDAYQRGVAVSIMIPRCANFQDDSNRKTMRRLLKKTNNGIAVYLSPKMVHTKMMITERYISFGSTNITKKAFKQLDELNLFVFNQPCAFQSALMESVKENYALAERVNAYTDISYNRFQALLEGMLV